MFTSRPILAVNLEGNWEDSILRFRILVYSLILVLAGCTASQWKTAEDKAEAVKEKVVSVAPLTRYLPPPAQEVVSPIVGAVAAIASAFAAFAAWRKRVATMKLKDSVASHAVTTKGFDVLSEVVDEAVKESPNPFTERIVTSARRNMLDTAVLKKLHHLSILRRDQ